MIPQPGGALEGVRILEVCQIMAGPFCGALLGDMGADVIKVEKPAGGDDARRMGRYFAGGEGYGFMNLNRNKRSIALNLKSQKGRALLIELARSADALIENFRPGTMDRLGLGYEDLRKANSGLIYASISGYGHTGPFREKGGFDLVAQGLSSLMSFTGEPGRPPVKIPVPLCDLNAGIYTAFSILSAYIHKQRTGEGQKIDTSLVDAGLGYTFWQSSQFFPEGEVPVPRGSAHEVTAPYQAFKCSDGYIVLGAANQPNWERTCKAMGREDLMERDEYKTDKDRAVNYLKLAEELEEAFGSDTRASWLQRLEAEGVPCGPILNMAETFDHPQIKARGMAVDVEHPAAGATRVLGFPPQLSGTPGIVRKPAPTLGQHTDEVMKELGKSAGETGRLREEGIVG
ncbi:MAG TPA: CoA transferase [Nitrospinae bacterium]|nr:CoA transferase [Nitrospinota bacterium]